MLLQIFKIKPKEQMYHWIPPKVHTTNVIAWDVHIVQGLLPVEMLSMSVAEVAREWNLLKMIVSPSTWSDEATQK